MEPLQGNAFTLLQVTFISRVWGASLANRMRSGLGLREAHESGSRAVGDQTRRGFSEGAVLRVFEEKDGELGAGNRRAMACRRKDDVAGESRDQLSVARESPEPNHVEDS